MSIVVSRTNLFSAEKDLPLVGGRKKIPIGFVIGYIKKRGSKDDVRVLDLCFSRLEKKEISRVEFYARVRSLGKKVHGAQIEKTEGPK